jgi:hypothetical protein
MGSLFAAGMQMLLDGQQSFIRSGLQCFLRIQNFAVNDGGDSQELGIPFVPPAGPETAETGFTDLEIIPPPEVRDVSMHNIGMSGGKLMFGARYFIVSNSFVYHIQEDYPEILDPYDVWRNWDGQLIDEEIQNQTASVIGLVYDNRLFSIEDIKHKEIAGETISWTLTCNASERQLDTTAASTEQP